MVKAKFKMKKKGDARLDTDEPAKVYDDQGLLDETDASMHLSIGRGKSSPETVRELFCMGIADD